MNDGEDEEDDDNDNYDRARREAKVDFILKMMKAVRDNLQLGVDQQVIAVRLGERDERDGKGTRGKTVFEVLDEPRYLVAVSKDQKGGGDCYLTSAAWKRSMQLYGFKKPENKRRSNIWYHLDEKSSAAQRFFSPTSGELNYLKFAEVLAKYHKDKRRVRVAAAKARKERKEADDAPPGDARRRRSEGAARREDASSESDREAEDAKEAKRENARLSTVLSRALEALFLQDPLRTDPIWNDTAEGRAFRPPGAPLLRPPGVRDLPGGDEDASDSDITAQAASNSVADSMMVFDDEPPLRGGGAAQTTTRPPGVARSSSHRHSGHRGHGHPHHYDVKRRSDGGARHHDGKRRSDGRASHHAGRRRSGGGAHHDDGKRRSGGGGRHTGRDDRRHNSGSGHRRHGRGRRREHSQY